MKENADAYQLPTSGVIGDATSLGGPYEEILPPSADGRFSPTTAGELRVTNISTSTSGALEDSPSTEFGESGGYRRFGSGPVRASDDGTRIGIGGGGGQFSTFPVKARSNTGASLGLGESFSTSVADAMRSDDGEGANVERNERRDSVKEWVPPPAVTVGGALWDGEEHGKSHSRNESQDSSQLPYAQESQDQRAVSHDALSVEKGVRFRTPSMEASGMGPVAPGVASPMFPSAGSGWGHNTNASSYDGEWEFEDEGTPWIRRHQR